MKTLMYLLSFVFLINFVAFPKDQKSSTSKDSLAFKIAQAYGVDSFSKVKSIQFTFNVDFGKNRKAKRSWVWDPQTNVVTYDGPGPNGKEIKLTYNRDKLDTANKEEKFVDGRFINDSYWLLFPFHLAWDNNVDITNEGKKKLPIGNGEETMLTVQYKNGVGYTPNDAFDLFVNKNNMITEWIYMHGGSETNKAPFTWQDNKKFGNITISTLHYGADKKGKIWFSNVKVNLG
jgi:hypothetical protein